MAARSPCDLATASTCVSAAAVAKGILFHKSAYFDRVRTPMELKPLCVARESRKREPSHRMRCKRAPAPRPAPRVRCTGGTRGVLSRSGDPKKPYAAHERRCAGEVWSSPGAPDTLE